jgi:hypothetical protein
MCALSLMYPVWLSSAMAGHPDDDYSRAAAMQHLLHASPDAGAAPPDDEASHAAMMKHVLKQPDDGDPFSSQRTPAAAVVADPAPAPRAALAKFKRPRRQYPRPNLPQAQLTRYWPRPSVITPEWLAKREAELVESRRLTNLQTAADLVAEEQRDAARAAFAQLTPSRYVLNEKFRFPRTVPTYGSDGAPAVMDAAREEPPADPVPLPPWQDDPWAYARMAPHMADASRAAMARLIASNEARERLAAAPGPPPAEHGPYGPVPSTPVGDSRFRDIFGTPVPRPDSESEDELVVGTPPCNTQPRRRRRVQCDSD